MNRNLLPVSQTGTRKRQELKRKGVYYGIKEILFQKGPHKVQGDIYGGSRGSARSRINNNPLKKKKDGSFSIEIELEKGKEYQFRYLLDGKHWENDWAADKYIPAPFSHTDNSVVIC